MALKDLLVHLDGSASSEARLALAAGLARQHGCHLTGLAVTDPSQFLASRRGEARLVFPATLEVLVTRARQELRDQVLKTEQTFHAKLRDAPFGHAWRMVEGDVATTVAVQARAADLAIIGQPDPEDPGLDGGDDLVHRVLLDAGRPVLLAPHGGRFEEGVWRVLVAWKSTRESARALHDALPLIDGARMVQVLTIGPRPGGVERDIPSGEEIAAHLARHGVSASAERIDRPRGSVADAILAHAAEMQADLLVMGGYGHSRVRELVLGGVTRSVLRQMKLPVLMAH
jgi:nucleotide-binding universal stress UspA family protein